MSDREVTPEELAVESPADVQTVRAAFFVLQHAGFQVVRGSDSLDAAWAEAEAALPEGWTIRSLSDDSTLPDGPWMAWAELRPVAGDAWESAEGPTPTAALRALAERLRERHS